MTLSSLLAHIEHGLHAVVGGEEARVHVGRVIVLDMVGMPQSKDVPHLHGHGPAAGVRALSRRTWAVICAPRESQLPQSRSNPNTVKGCWHTRRWAPKGGTD